MQFCVIGLGRFGTALAVTLTKKGHEVLAIEKDEARAQSLEDKIGQIMIFDSTNEAAMRRVGLSEFDWVVVAMSSDLEASILTTMIVKNAGAKKVCAKAFTDIHANILKKLGVDKVVFPESEMGENLAEILSSTSIFHFIELSEEYSIVEISSPSFFWDKSLQETDARRKYGINIIAVKRKEPFQKDKSGTFDYKENLIISPRFDFMIKEGDILVALGRKDDIAKLGKKR